MYGKQCFRKQDRLPSHVIYNSLLLFQEVDEDNVSESTASCRTTSTQELQDLNEKFETFRRTSDLVFYSSKEEPDHIDSNTRNYSTNSKNSALSTSKSFDMIAQFQQTSFNDQV